MSTSWVRALSRREKRENEDGTADGAPVVNSTTTANDDASKAPVPPVGRPSGKESDAAVREKSSDVQSSSLVSFEAQASKKEPAKKSLRSGSGRRGSDRPTHTETGTVLYEVREDETMPSDGESSMAGDDDDEGMTMNEKHLKEHDGLYVEQVSSLNVFEMIEESTTPEKPRYRLRPGMKVWQFIVMLIGECALASGIIAMYSMLGLGAQTYGELANDENWKLSWAVAGASIAMFGLLWILDATEAAAQRGSTLGKTLTFMFAFIACCGLVLSGMLSIKEYETLPLSMYMLLKAAWVRVLKSSVCKRTHIGSFLRHAAAASYFLALASIVAWGVWVFLYDKKWDESMFDAYERKLGCTDTDASSASAGDGSPGGCENAVYVMYAAPIAVAGLNLVYGLSCSKLAKKAGALHLVALLAAMVAFGTWVSVALSAIEMGVADDVIQLAVVFCAIFGVACLITAGPTRIIRQVHQNKLAKKVIGYTQSDLAKAMLFCCTMTLLPFCLAVSAVSSAARKLGLSLYKRPPDMPKDGILTASTNALLAWWFEQPTKIFKYSAWLSIIYFVFSIGVGKGAILFLAWLVDVLGALNVGTVIAVFILIGVAMFLLPPVPGPPVYLTGGILVVGKLEADWGFWPSVLVCVCVCWFTKLLACAMQQKLIGELLGKSASIRHTVGINSLQMRAIRYCLEQKGFSIPKIAILCGGPDWPTSVLCGILRLSLFQCILGTAPVLILFLGYTTVAGALQLKVGACAGPDGVVAPVSGNWGMLNSIFLALAFISMMATSLSAVYFMEKTIEDKREELDAIPLDEEVLVLEEQQKAKEEAYAAVTQWEVLKPVSKYALVIAAVSGILSCQLGVVLSQRSFASFSVSCPVAVKDVVKPTGWISIALITICYLSIKVFSVIAANDVKNKLAQMGSGQPAAQVKGRV